MIDVLTTQLVEMVTPTCAELWNYFALYTLDRQNHDDLSGAML